MWQINQSASPKIPITIQDDSVGLVTGVLLVALRWINGGAGVFGAAAGTLTEGTGSDTGSYFYQPTALETGTLGLCKLHSITAGQIVIGGDVLVGPMPASGNWNTAAPDNAGIAAAQASSASASATAAINASQLSGLQSQADALVTAVADLPGAVDTRLSDTHGAASWESSTAGGGDVAVNQDTGGAGNLTPLRNGVGLPGVRVLAYEKTAYLAGGRTPAGETATIAQGKWGRDMMLFAGTYVITFDLYGYGLGTKEVTLGS